MKVWIFAASEILPLSKANNRLLRAGLIGKYLNDNNHDVTWFSGTFNHFEKKHLYDYDIVVELNKSYRLNLIHSIGYKKNISLSRIIDHKMMGIKLKNKIKKLEKPNLIYAAFPTVEFALEAVKYGKKYNVPVIVDIRDLWPDIFEHNLTGIIKFCSKPYVKYLDYKTKYIMKNATNLMSISNLMLEWGLNKANRKKTKNDKSFFIGYEKNVEKTKKIKIDKNKFNISFFATINNQFNYDFIIELAKKLEKDDIDILICGIGPQLEDFKNKSKKIKNIKFLGWLDKSQLSYVLSKSKLGLLPYKNTFDFQMSVSNKFGEYISYGLPILITCDGYMKKLIKKYNIGIGTTNLDEIRKYVLKIKNDKEKYKEISNNSSELFNEKFDANKIYKDLVKYLEKIKKEYEI